MNTEKKCQSSTSSFNRRDEGDRDVDQQEAMGRNPTENEDVGNVKLNHGIYSQKVASSKEYTSQTKQPLNQIVLCDNNEKSGSNSKDHISLTSTPQMDKLIPSVVLDTKPECDAHLQDMMVDVDKSSIQHAPPIPEEPHKDSMEEHIRYNTRWKRRARYGAHHTRPIMLDVSKSRKRNSNEISQTPLNERANMMDHASSPKKSKFEAMAITQRCLNK